MDTAIIGDGTIKGHLPIALYHDYGHDEIPDWVIELDNPGLKVVVDPLGNRWVFDRTALTSTNDVGGSGDVLTDHWHWWRGSWSNGIKLKTYLEHHEQERKRYADNDRRAAVQSKLNEPVKALKAFVVKNARVPQRFIKFTLNTRRDLKKIGLDDLLLLVQPAARRSLKKQWSAIFG